MHSQRVCVGAQFVRALVVTVSDTYQHIHHLLCIGTKSLTDMVLRYAEEKWVSLLLG